MSQVWRLEDKVKDQIGVHCRVKEEVSNLGPEYDGGRQTIGKWLHQISPFQLLSHHSRRPPRPPVPTPPPPTPDPPPAPTLATRPGGPDIHVPDTHRPRHPPPSPHVPPLLPPPPLPPPAPTLGTRPDEWS